MKNIFFLAVLCSLFIFSSCDHQKMEDDVVPASQETIAIAENDKAVNTGKASFTIDNEDRIINEKDELLLTNSSINAISYHWDFGNGDTSTAAQPAYKYNIHGNYTIKLTVTDEAGNKHEVSNEILVLCLFGGGDHDQ